MFKRGKHKKNITIICILVVVFFGWGSDRKEIVDLKIAILFLNAVFFVLCPHKKNYFFML